LRVGLLGPGVSQREALETAILAEEIGFDGFFLPEHTRSRSGLPRP